MRYIHNNINSPAVALLNDWNKLRKQVGQKLSYNDFNNKPLLNDILREEQGGICCYCQQKINHYQGTNIESSHNEHLFPEKGKNNTKKERQTEYVNLYACCNYSKGMKKSQQHCGEAKHDEVIYEFVKWVDCNTHFKYNSKGEITPQGSYNTLDEFEANESNLTFKQKEALNAIKILNLNQSSLVQKRKKEQTVLFEILTKLTKSQVKEKIQEFNNERPYKQFVDMLLYYMKQKK